MAVGSVQPAVGSEHLVVSSRTVGSGKYSVLGWKLEVGNNGTVHG